MCPSCTTAYDIPPLQRPRKLRCARCATEWRMTPEEDETASAELSLEAAPVDAAEPAQAPDGITLASLHALPLLPSGAGRIIADAPSPAGRDDLLWVVLWALSAAAITAWIVALWHWRGPIGHAWPPSLRLYRLLPGAGSARMA